TPPGSRTPGRRADRARARAAGAARAAPAARRRSRGTGSTRSRSEKVRPRLVAAEERAAHRARDRGRVHERRDHATDAAEGLVEHADLPQHRRAVVVDLLAEQSIVLVERVDAAQGKLDVAAGAGQASPRPRVRAADDDLEDDRLFGDVAAAHVDV